MLAFEDQFGAGIRKILPLLGTVYIGTFKEGGAEE